MALRQRLITASDRDDGPAWHPTTWASVRAASLWAGERRMDAESYLSSGFGIRLAIEGKPAGWSRLGSQARAWAPPRIKTILVAPEHGVPYLNTSQAFEFRPSPRKWLALGKTLKGDARLVREGTVLVMASANVGRTTVAVKAHEGHVVSHHFMRVEPTNPAASGWTYAYLRSRQAQAMMSGSQYASVIRHIEPQHVESLPVPEVSEDVKARFAAKLARVIALRNEAHGLTLEAEAMYAAALGPLPVPVAARGLGFTVRASALTSGRRRLEAAAHAPVVLDVRRHQRAAAVAFETISAAGYAVWLPGRFKRVPAREGVQLWESSALLEVNPQPSKRIADGAFGDDYRGRVEAGWVLMTRSGQTYGIIGATVLATPAMEGHVISDDVIRLKPPDRGGPRPGYLVTALSHPRLGLPLVKAMAYGSSIPHIDVADVKAFEVARLEHAREVAIADTAEAAAERRAQADLLEQELTRDAEAIIDEFVHRPALRLVADAVASAGPEADAAEFESLAGQWERERPRGADVDEMADHPAYRRIVEMGERAVPFLLNRLAQKPGHWFAALHAITGENPVPPDAEGKVKQMAAAWLRWGSERGMVVDRVV
ncbi:MAG TPA: hypothetical protein VK324_07230 [Tepidisphaeraceae bacterium]|nr:hypothetical protein [Tepidisphaeraceae bacterium]